jgi:7-carboxy-7-deazaguanine synthase
MNDRSNNNSTSDMVEIFSSIQGEGLLVGLRQIFLRFHSCNLACSYCDTTAAKDPKAPEFCVIEKTPGRRDFINAKNPVTFDHINAVIDRWHRGWPGTHHSISLTGGEPLVHVDTLVDWIPALRDTLPIYLETNGVLHNNLDKLIKHLDFISMDIKLPSTSGHSGLWEDHKLFIQIASRKNLLVKVVIGEETQEWEIIKACETISSVNREIPLILQPKTLNNGRIGIKPLQTLQFQEIAGMYLKETRIIPQTHIFSGFL